MCYRAVVVHMECWVLRDVYQSGFFKEEKPIGYTYRWMDGKRARQTDRRYLSKEIYLKEYTYAIVGAVKSKRC